LIELLLYYGVPPPPTDYEIMFLENNFRKQRKRIVDDYSDADDDDEEEEEKEEDQIKYDYEFTFSKNSIRSSSVNNNHDDTLKIDIETESTFLSHLIFILIQPNYYPIERVISNFGFDWLLKIAKNKKDFDILVNKYQLLDHAYDLDLLGVIDRQIVIIPKKLNFLEKKSSKYTYTPYDHIYENPLIEYSKQIQQFKCKLNKLLTLSQIFKQAFLTKFFPSDLSNIIMEYLF
jgi:hypothetical protein